MTGATVALDFIDIAIEEMESQNYESAHEFVEDAHEIINTDSEFEDVVAELDVALKRIDAEEYTQAHDHISEAWVKLHRKV